MTQGPLRLSIRSPEHGVKRWASKTVSRHKQEAQLLLGHRATRKHAKDC